MMNPFGEADDENEVKSFLDQFEKVIFVSEGSNSEYTQEKANAILGAIELLPDYGFLILLKFEEVIS